MIFPILLPLLVILAAALPSKIQTRAQKCYSGVYIIVCRGTFEPEGLGLQAKMSDAIIARIPDSNATAVVYPATTDVATGVPIGVNSTQQLMTDYYNSCPGHKMVLLGYSQGAVVVGNALAGGNTSVPVFGSTGQNKPISQAVGANVAAVVLYGDLNQNIAQGFQGETMDKCTKNSTYPRSGPNYEAMQFYNDRLEEWCAETDGACCDGEINLFAHLGYITDANANATADFVAANFNAGK